MPVHNALLNTFFLETSVNIIIVVRVTWSFLAFDNNAFDLDGENSRPKKSPITNQNEKNALSGPRKHEV